MTTRAALIPPQYHFMKPLPFANGCRHSLAALTLICSPSTTAEDAPSALAETEAGELEPLVVTAAAEQTIPLRSIIDPRNAIQPIPAQDGADLLKTTPGVAVSRKGGTGGEVLVRGQGGSRVGMLVNGGSIMGGCPFRMDSPTCYIFPETFDKVTVIKGPETVTHGPGNSAGVVLFDRTPERLAKPEATVDASLTYGSFARNDESIRATAGTPDFYATLGYDHTQSDDYEDGNGDLVHSQYDRSIGNFALGWTPDADTLLELSGAISEGEAAYAGMSMDATQLDYESLGVLFRRENLSPLLAKIEARLSYNYADHIMDDFSLRTPGMMMMGASRVDHRVFSGNVLAELTPAEGAKVSTGLDFEDSTHRDHDTGTWETDGTIGDVGVFAEWRQEIRGGHRVISGARIDRWTAEDQRDQIPTGGMMGGMTANPTAGDTRVEALPAGFVRYEHDLDALPATAYAGLGFTERAPDYWELFPNESTASVSSFLTEPEKTTQLDVGIHYEKGAVTAWASGFINRVNDYILYQQVTDMMGAVTTVTRNVDTWSFGGESGVSYEFLKHWKADASLSYVWGENLTDDCPLAQQPPLDSRFGLTYATDVWSVGGLLRLAAAQDRYAVGQGTLTGQDLGPTGGFGVFSLNASWKINEHATLAAGVDNLFDKTYAESVSRGGAAVAGYPTTERVNEPGRMVWARLSMSF
jgi:iron complex outermembrane receptor protein